MKYWELEENLLFFDTASKDYSKYSQGSSEQDKESSGFILGELKETHELLLHALTDSKEDFEMVTRFFEEHCPNTFNVMIANLDSNAAKYESLYDLCIEINIKREDNFDFPLDCLKKIKIYK